MLTKDEIKKLLSAVDKRKTSVGAQKYLSQTYNIHIPLGLIRYHARTNGRKLSPSPNTNRKGPEKIIATPEQEQKILKVYGELNGNYTLLAERLHFYLQTMIRRVLEKHDLKLLGKRKASSPTIEELAVVD